MAPTSQEPAEPYLPTPHRRFHQAPSGRALSVLSAYDFTYVGQPWRREASCKDKDPDIFFPGQSESNHRAIAICSDCPVRIDCLEYAIETKESFGIWGGLLPQDRAYVREQMKKGETMTAAANAAISRRLRYAARMSGPGRKIKAGELISS